MKRKAEVINGIIVEIATISLFAGILFTAGAVMAKGIIL